MIAKRSMLVMANPVGRRMILPDSPDWVARGAAWGAGHSDKSATGVTTP